MLDYFRFKEIHDLYSRGRVEDARNRLDELQSRYMNLCDENAMLHTQIQGYEDILYLSRSLVFDGLFFWLITGSIKQGPFCPDCYNRDGLLLRLTDDGASRHCLTCGSRHSHANAPAQRRQPRQAVSGMTRGECVPAPAREGGESLERKRGATVIPFALSR